MIIYSPRRIAPVTLVVGLLGAVLIGLPCQAPRELWVTSNPPGASVSFRGRPCGVTPCRILVGPRGPLRLQSTGYLPEEEFLRLQAPAATNCT